MSFVDIVQHSRLQATEAKIVRGALHLRPRELDGVGIAFFCSLVHLWSARVAEAHRAGHFIECFTSRVIAGAANDFKLSVILYNNQMGMSARHDQAHKRRFQIRVLNVVCRHMSLNVMDTHKGFLCRKSNGFCLSHTNQKSPHKPRAVGHANGIHICQSYPGVLQGLGYNLVDLLNMLS